MHSKCDFWTSHAKKHTCTKFQLDRSFRPEVNKKSVNSKWWILVLVKHFVQIFKYRYLRNHQELGAEIFRVTYKFSMLPTNGAKIKKYERDGCHALDDFIWDCPKAIMLLLYFLRYSLPKHIRAE